MIIIFFPNGNTAVFKDGQQVPELQSSWLLMFVEFLKTKGVKPEECIFEMPDGRKAQYLAEYGNWRLL